MELRSNLSPPHPSSLVNSHRRDASRLSRELRRLRRWPRSSLERHFIILKSLTSVRFPLFFEAISPLYASSPLRPSFFGPTTASSPNPSLPSPFLYPSPSSKQHIIYLPKLFILDFLVVCFAQLDAHQHQLSIFALVAT